MAGVEMVVEGVEGRALRTISSEGRKEMSNARAGTVSSVAERSERSSSTVSPKRGRVRRKAFRGALLERSLRCVSSVEAVLAAAASAVARMRTHSERVFMGAITKRGVLKTATWRWGSGSMLSLSRPKSSEREWRKARWWPGIGLKRRRFSLSSAAKTRNSRSWVWAHFMDSRNILSVSLE